MPRRRRMSQEELARVGRRLRELRLAAGMTQAELAGRRFSHAYVSVLEAGRREPSRAAVDYFAQRLGVAVEELWSERGASWALQMAEDLQAEGAHAESRALLTKTLSNLERDRELHPRVLVVLHRELARIDLRDDPESAAEHLRSCLELAGDDDSLLAERAEAHAGLGDLFAREGKTADALGEYQKATSLLLELVGRRPSLVS
ncbi:MAG TPA: helix-turn-helix transcriptional regulator [Actinomycetota bacterium]|nr:helix-turn-helix transcriptional regulator [Actinomycetota bacterium]